MQMSCSARLMQPFMRLVAARGADQDLVPKDFWLADPNGRVSLRAAHDMLLGGIERLQDETLGLKLGKTMRFGEGGPFDYAVRSAATLRDSVGVATRYSRLLTDSFRIWLEIWREHALVRLDDGSSWPRAAGDFAMSAFYKLHLADEVPEASQLECWFPYSAPRTTLDYEQIFPGVALKFGAPFFAFAFNREYADAPVPGAEPVLHSIHCARVDSLIAAARGARGAKTKVRDLIEQGIRSQGGANLGCVARALHLSRRTMSRRLEQEGTSFTEELDGVRRDLAIEYVAESNMPLTEVAFSLGFSHAESFHRAFKRWTGETPLAYRKRAPNGAAPHGSS
jgi:AraC-like DNA-binding protein